MHDEVLLCFLLILEPGGRTLGREFESPHTSTILHNSRNVEGSIDRVIGSNTNALAMTGRSISPLGLLLLILAFLAMTFDAMEVDNTLADTLTLDPQKSGPFLPIGLGASRLPRAASLSDTHMECMESGFCSLGKVKPWQG